MDKILLEWRVNEALQDMHPMHFAARRGDVEVLKALIGRGHFSNCMTIEQVTPLHEASSRGHIQAVEFLLDEGAWINATDIDGATPLCEACAFGQTEVARLLLDRNASVNPPMFVALINSPLHEAVMKGHFACVKLLISKGAKLNEADRQYGTPLHAACVSFKVNTDCIIALVQAGAQVNATIIHKTPIHIAAYRNQISVVKILLAYGANVYMRDNAGKKPSELAKQNSVVQKILIQRESHPRTLCDCCRLVILRSFVVGKNNISLIKQLGLPQTIVQYIFSH